MKILIIEDEENLAKLLKKGLEGHGYAVDFLTNGEEGLKRIEYNFKDYDLFIIDWMLPKISGLGICKAIRERGINTPVIALTAKADTESKIEMLDAGADDYITKPFEFGELEARIRALVRRPATTLPTELRVREITLNPNSRRVTHGDREITLTLKEFRLLEYLMRHAGDVVKRIDLNDNIWDFDFDSFSNVIDVYMNRLRDKLDHDRSDNLIETVIGIGYKMNK